MPRRLDRAPQHNADLEAYRVSISWPQLSNRAGFEKGLVASCNVLIPFHDIFPEVTAASQIMKPDKPLLWEFVRFVLYTVALIGLLLGWPHVVQRWGLGVFLEDGPFELTQLTILLAIVFLSAVAYVRVPSKGPFALLLMLFVWCLGRENDAWFDRLLPFGGWQLVSFAGAFVCALLAYRARSSFNLGWQAFRGRGFGMVWAGVVILGPIAQSVGHRPLLLLLFAGDYSFEAKQALEEFLEMFGYLVCLAGVTEMLIEQAEKSARP